MGRWVLVVGLVSWTGCAVVELTRIDIRVQHGGGVSGAGSRSFTTDLGNAVEITTGLVALQSVELVPCTQTTGLWQRIRRSLTPVPTARAHTQVTPTLLGIPFVENIIRLDDEPATVGTLEAPAVDFCSLWVTLGPADVDVVGFVEGDEMFGTTLRLVGTYDGANALLVEAVGAANREIRLTPPFAPVASESAASVLTLNYRYDRWLDGLDLVTARPSEILRRVVDSIEVR